MNLTVVQIDEFRELILETVKEAVSAAVPKPEKPFSEFPELLTRRQTAALLGVSIATVDNWANEGRLQKHRIGVSVRFKKAEVLDALNALQKYQRS